jgi:DNA-binding CsgD family transcriptional regulator
MAAVSVTVREARDAMSRVCARRQAPLDLFQAVAPRLRALVPYAAAGWLTTDPTTHLITGLFAENVTPDQQRRLIANELKGDDVTLFVDLATSRSPTARLSAVTRGDLAVSRRHRELYAPFGYGDELRAVFRVGDVTWGQLCLTRRANEPFFTSREEDLVADVAAEVAEALRASMLTETPIEPTGAAGVLVLGGDDTLTAASPEADVWLSRLPDEGLDLPSVVYEVAGQARVLAEGPTPDADFPPAQARVCTPDGEWVVIRASCLSSERGAPGAAVLIIEPATPGDLAALTVRLHELTSREREVAGLLVAGGSMDQIAETLWISPHTLRGHVKSIFAKLGVRSRPELTALLSHGALADGAPTRST